MSKENFVKDTMQAYGSRRITSVAIAKDSRSEYVLELGSQSRAIRVTLHASYTRQQHINAFLAFVVDFVTGSQDPIVPLTALRELSPADIVVLQQQAADGKFQVGDIVALIERTGGIHSVNVTDVCARTYRCPPSGNVLYDPMLEDEACELTEGRGITFPLRQLDHLFALDFLLFGAETIRPSLLQPVRGNKCTFVPNRSTGGDILVATDMDQCCFAHLNAEGPQSNFTNLGPWLDKTCHLHPKVITRYSMFWPKMTKGNGKTLGTAVKEFLQRLPSAKFTDEISSDLDRFANLLDERLDLLLDAAVTQCLDQREEMAYDEQT